MTPDACIRSLSVRQKRRADGQRRESGDSGTCVGCAPRFCKHSPLRVPQFKPLPHEQDGSGFKGMQLLGFTHASALPLYLNLRSADYVLPVPMKAHPSGLWNSGGEDPTNAARRVRLHALSSQPLTASSLQVCDSALVACSRHVRHGLGGRCALLAAGAFVGVSCLNRA